MPKTDIWLLSIFHGWNSYNQSLVNAVEPLTPEQLNWRPKEKFNSVGGLVRHIDLGRLTWLLRVDAHGGLQYNFQSNTKNQ